MIKIFNIICILCSFCTSQVSELNTSKIIQSTHSHISAIYYQMFYIQSHILQQICEQQVVSEKHTLNEIDKILKNNSLTYIAAQLITEHSQILLDTVKKSTLQAPNLLKHTAYSIISQYALFFMCIQENSFQNSIDHTASIWASNLNMILLIRHCIQNKLLPRKLLLIDLHIMYQLTSSIPNMTHCTTILAGIAFFHGLDSQFKNISYGIKQTLNKATKLEDLLSYQMPTKLYQYSLQKYHGRIFYIIPVNYRVKHNIFQNQKTMALFRNINNLQCSFKICFKNIQPYISIILFYSIIILGAIILLLTVMNILYICYYMINAPEYIYKIIDKMTVIM